jgi:hypothetical protein
MQEADVRLKWSDVLSQVLRGKKRVRIEQSDSRVAALVSAEDLERLLQVDRQREERFKALDRSWEAFKDVPDDVLEAEVVKAVAEAREEIRQELQSRSSADNA